ncbi:MAG: tRNA (guanine-N7-)-methyltransferase, partial [Pseudomonadota bacterium]|nr:tRNA (guanine-N7-)-methyltransferase [Pseudomonadota bacterium]
MSEEKLTGVDTEEGVYTAGRAGHIRSYVLRQGRVSSAQQRYYE